MGADLYIEKISERNRRKWQPVFAKAVEKRDALPKDSPEQVAAQVVVDAAYEKMMADDGYFRDPYNMNSVAWRIGLSWWQDVDPKLDKRGNLSVTETRKLLKRVKASTVVGLTKEELLEKHAMVDEGENSPEAWLKGWQEGRLKLIAFLEHAIKIRQPIACSL